MTDAQAKNGPDDGDDRRGDEERTGGHLMFWGIVIVLLSAPAYFGMQAAGLTSAIAAVGISIFLAGFGQRKRWWF